MTNKIEHLKLIQEVTNRMSRNSFLLKGWSVIIVSALFALAANNANSYVVGLAYFPSIAFWILDGYFLRQERLFRALYDWVRELEEDDIDFSMSTSIVQGKVSQWAVAVFSKTLFIFHGAVLVSITIVLLLILKFAGGT